MKNHDYEYVRTIVQEGNFSKAAQKLYISQPALSAAIKKIEKDLNGIPLFDRSVNPVKLTVEGEYWLEKAREIDRIETQIREHFAAAAGIRSGMWESTWNSWIRICLTATIWERSTCSWRYRHLFL